MSLSEFYKKVGGDYKDVFERLGDDETIGYFAIKFLSDTSYALIKQSLKEKNFKNAFRAAHTLKGVSQNLGFGHLVISSSALTEALRKETQPAQELIKQLDTDYLIVTDAIYSLKNENQAF